MAPSSEGPLELVMQLKSILLLVELFVSRLSSLYEIVAWHLQGRDAFCHDCAEEHAVSL